MSLRGAPETTPKGRGHPPPARSPATAEWLRSSRIFNTHLELFGVRPAAQGRRGQDDVYGQIPSGVALRTGERWQLRN